MTKLRLLVLAMFASLALLPVANAQTSSATITGTVTDPSGGAIVGAKVQITNDQTKLVNEFTTDSGGRYQFNVAPGDYSFHIAQSGFKAYDAKINVVPTERYDMHEIKLSVGDVATSVEVEGEIAHVQTDSSDKTIAVNEQQIEDTPSAGRNFLNVLRSLPGTATTTTSDGRGGTGASGGGGAPAVNGGAGQLLVTLNGIASQDSGAPGTGGYQAPSVDAIGEVQVMVSNYTAEYGARNGGQMNVTIKNGTNQFHGTAYFYYRHEEFDANEWFNNKNYTVPVGGTVGVAVPKPIYRYQNPGGTIGGPLYIPGKFNRDRNKLFFFYSDDELFHKGTNGPNRYTMPTALERSGDFSLTGPTSNFKLTSQTPIYEPNTFTGTGTQVQFPGNVIPGSQISPQGYALLNLFPLPNTVDPAGQGNYNYADTFRNRSPEMDRILRVDMPLGKKTSFYVSALQDYYATFGVGSLLQASGAGWGQFLSDYGVPNVGLAANLVHTFRPNLINELTAGTNRSHQIVQPENPNATCSSNPLTLQTGAALQYSCNQLGSPLLKGPGGQSIALPNLFPGANTLNTIPNIAFSVPSGYVFSQQSAGQGVFGQNGSTPSFGFDSRWPFSGTDYIISITNNLTWIKGTHTVKGGFYLEHDNRDVSIYNNYNTNGSINFATDRANVNDTNYPFANALVGTMFGYGADNKRQVNHSFYTTVEFFLQDTWKVSRRLTLDYGVRIQSIGPEEDQGAQLGFFNTSSYDPNKVGQLLFPAVVGGKKVAQNPKTLAVYPYALVNTFDPASYANNGGFPWSGAKFYTTSFWNRGTPNIGPRIGFAYDLLGNGKMAIRGGFGIFYGRATSVDQIAASGAGVGPAEVAPNFQAPAYAYPTFTSLVGSTASFAPQTIYGGTPNILNPQTLQWSFGVQRDLGKGTILDVSYLGWVTHHGFSQTGYDFNNVAPYTDWKPTPGPGTDSCGRVTAFLDPTNPGTASCTTGAFLNANLMRGMINYEGWSAININTNSGESNYNALQVQFNKRFGKRLQFGANYTWAKQLSYSPGGSNQDINTKLTYNVGNTRPQVVNVNFGYRLQDGTKLLPSGARNYVTKLFMDGWNLNGVLSFYDGTAGNIGCSVSGAPIGYWYGTPTQNPGLRCQMNGGLYLASGATPSSVGSSADPRLWYPFNAGPGVNNSVSGFSLPGPASFGLGNEPLTLFYGPGFENEDLSVYKQITLGKETRVLEFRAEAFNTFNHFNPSNPNTGLTFNYTSGAETTTNFGSITGAQNTARHMALSLRLRF